MELITKGQTFNRWTITEDQLYPWTKYVKAVCTCGTKREVNCHNLKSGRTSSCGCIVSEINVTKAKNRIKHPVNVGDRFGRLTVVDPTNREKVVCQCDCGKTITTRASNMYRGCTKSCGCKRTEQAIEMGHNSATYYGYARHTLFGTWRRFRANGSFTHEPWYQDVKVFINELEAEIGPRPGRQFLEPINPEEGIKPGNVRWSPTRKQPRPGILSEEQQREVVMLCNAGLKQYEIAERFGVSKSLICSVMRRHRSKQ